MREHKGLLERIRAALNPTGDERTLVFFSDVHVGSKRVEEIPEEEWTYIPWSGEPSPEFPKQLSFATSYSVALTYPNAYSEEAGFLYWLQEITKNPSVIEDPRFLEWAVSEYVTPKARPVVVDGDTFAVSSRSFGVMDVYVPVKVDTKNLKVTMLGWADAGTAYFDDECFCAGGDMVLLNVNNVEHTPY